MRIIRLEENGAREFASDLLARGTQDFTAEEAAVREILAAVREKGDAAILEYEARFDHCEMEPKDLRVTPEEIRAAYDRLDPELVGVMRRAAENIRSYHEKQVTQSWFTTKDGILLGQKVTPIAVSGCYVPGGKAAYPSSVLMNVIPAKVAGVPRIVVVSPPDAQGRIPDTTLVSADIAGADEIYKVGGAQAIGALAYGTETIPRVDKITGPGNIYVALAKKACFGVTGIDSVAGPSEILVIADDSADPHYVAADLLSQAEHDPMASAVLLTTSPALAGAVQSEIEAFLATLSRADIIRASLDRYGCIFIADEMETLLAAADEIASEHVEILTRDPFEVMTRLHNAGAIFLGNYSSEPLGDYYAGPNHILPTNGTARFFSPLGVDQFVKKSSVISYSREALMEAKDDIIRFAESEGLTAHANSIRVRFEKEEEQ